jgi:hypothetical protein
MHAGGGHYRKNKKEDFASKTISHYKNKFYRISLEAEEITEPKTKKDGAEYKWWSVVFYAKRSLYASFLQ